jgi:hypothetical protein
VAADGRALIVEHAGEHVRVLIDDEVRAAVRGQAQPQMRLESRISPREVQRRIRGGETAAQIAADAGVAIEQIARFEGPVLAERAWQVEQARATEVDGITLDERVDEANGDADEPAWDAWLDEDGSWRVAAVLGDGRRPVWSWSPRTRRLRGRDDLARFVLSGDIAANDLEAVLRPLASARRLQAAPEPAAPVEPASAADHDEAGPALEDRAVDDRAVESRAVEDRAVESGGNEDRGDHVGDDAHEGGREDPGDSRRRRRRSVPSWDEIVLGASRPRADD